MIHQLKLNMEWYNYLAVFFSGAFLTNAVPHFIHGISGDKFPTPFAKPPGKGLSSPIVNVLWGNLNIIIGYVLYKAGNTDLNIAIHAGLFFAAMIIMSVLLGINFQQKHKE